ncbi:hypothetical protein EOD39_8826 [Acipenser ruthenus]|uniref:Uncharacterized protein n=1 Tax=Acipenser ruthenus TaxID=7906 RepID=A0A444U2I8_ACIRT|nr:hypothetical protein EOD39_8826 [Acipenser ruthenus]
MLASKYIKVEEVAKKVVPKGAPTAQHIANVIETRDHMTVSCGFYNAAQQHKPFEPNSVPDYSSIKESIIFIVVLMAVK